MERDRIKVVSNAYAMDSLKHMKLCARPDICFVVRIMSGHSISSLELWVDIKHIL